MLGYSLTFRTSEKAKEPRIVLLLQLVSRELQYAKWRRDETGSNSYPLLAEVLSCLLIKIKEKEWLLGEESVFPCKMI